MKLRSNQAGPPSEPTAYTYICIEPIARFFCWDDLVSKNPNVEKTKKKKHAKKEGRKREYPSKTKCIIEFNFRVFSVLRRN